MKSDQQFTAMEKVSRVKRKSGKMVKMVMVLYFFKAATGALTGKFSFRFGQILFHLAHSFAANHARSFVCAFFKVSANHLFHNLESKDLYEP